MNDGRCASGDDHAAVPTARKCGDSALDLSGVAHVDWAQLHPERWRHGLDRAELADPGCYGGIPKDGRSRHARRDLFEQLLSFPKIPSARIRALRQNQSIILGDACMPSAA